MNFKPEKHKTQHIGWLRAAVLGANDGIVSTSSLLAGIASSGADHKAIIVAGFSSLVAGAVSMAAGEYVSVSSQSDTEKADIAIERMELINDPESELDELANIYVGRGLEPNLAKEVAKQLMKKDALSAHARDELGISENIATNPIQAALSSAAAFSVGAILPTTTAIFAPVKHLTIITSITSLFFLAILGTISAYIGGADLKKSAVRVTFWGALAMALTAAVGSLFGTSPA